MRLVGVSVSGLERDITQIPLFADERKRKFIAEAMDSVVAAARELRMSRATLYRYIKAGP